MGPIAMNLVKIQWWARPNTVTQVRDWKTLAGLILVAGIYSEKAMST
jgi:hypothetical protein